MFGGVGVVVARRQPNNPVGWLLIGVVLLAGLSIDAGPAQPTLDALADGWFGTD